MNDAKNCRDCANYPCNFVHGMDLAYSFMRGYEQRRAGDLLNKLADNCKDWKRADDIEPPF